MNSHVGKLWAVSFNDKLLVIFTKLLPLVKSKVNWKYIYPFQLHLQSHGGKLWAVKGTLKTSLLQLSSLEVFEVTDLSLIKSYNA